MAAASPERPPQTSCEHSLRAHEHSLDARERSLDALRGIAATNVLVLHVLTVFWLPPFPNHEYWAGLRRILELTPLSLLWAGNQAVLLFFALSGFALYRMLEGASLSWSAYYVRRFFRLWPPYVFSILLGLLAVTFVEPTVFRPSIFLDPKAPNLVSGQDLLQHLLMVGEFNTFKINPVIWSLVHEMRMSLAFPLLFVLLRRVEWPWIFAASVALAGFAAQFERPSFVPMELSSWWRTLHYQAYFTLGAVIAQQSAAIRLRFQALPTGARLALALFAVLLYSDMLHVFSRAAVFVGAGLIMVIALASERARKLLAAPWLQGLGRISFSLYLLHRLVLVNLANVAYPDLGLATIALLAVPLAFAAAALSHRFVEVPANRLGKALARTLRPATARSAT